jgi:peptidoglycan/xylan/chitin deacetylase (PgdA/CDA1 family)
MPEPGIQTAQDLVIRPGSGAFYNAANATHLEWGNAAIHGPRSRPPPDWTDACSGRRQGREAGKNKSVLFPESSVGRTGAERAGNRQRFDLRTAVFGTRVASPWSLDSFYSFIVLSRALKKTFFAASRASGANWALRRILGQRCPLILCYHSVVGDDHSDESFLYRNAVSASHFEKQLQFLNRHFHPISTADLMDHMNRGTKLRPRSVLVTFDDGYRNNLTQAAPLLARYGTPALFSVTTGYIGRRDILWPDEVNLRVLHWPAAEIPFPVSSGEERFEVAKVPAERGARIQLAERIRSRCKALSDDVRVGYVERLREQDCPALEQIDHELYDFLSWDEVRTMARSGFEIGSHTVTHPILTKVSARELAYQLTESKARIEAEICRSCTSIVYPNGQATDYSPEVERAAKNAGYAMGFIATGSYASFNGGWYRINRIGVPGQQPLEVFESRVSGLHTWAKGLV